MTASAFEIRELCVGYGTSGDVKRVVSDVSLRVEAGQILGLAGESGCGKSTTVLAATGFPVPGMAERSGQSLLGDVDLLACSRKELRRHWGRAIAYLPQDASTSLTPNRTIGSQLVEVLRAHLDVDESDARARAAAMLEQVELPGSCGGRYPFEFSGGQQQRIALAIALACEPLVLILDEPTTGLDVSTQAIVSSLIEQLVRRLGTATIYVSHDLALLNGLCDVIAIMYAGEVVEQAPARALFSAPRHPYTSALLDAVPAVDRDETLVAIAGVPPGRVVEDRCAFAARCRHARDECRAGPIALRTEAGRSVRCIRAAELGKLGSERRPLGRVGRPDTAPVILSARGLTCTHGRGRDARVVLEEFSVDVVRSEILGIVGESGSGKSTLLRTLVGLHGAAAGEVRYNGIALPLLTGDRQPLARREIQIVFQNPASSLNPRHSVRRILRRPLDAYFPERGGKERARRVEELLADVQLDSGVLDRHPSELSGGQQQRVALARALAAEPRVVLCDEVVSALDVSVQAAVLELVRRLRRDADLTVLFVTHDLSVVRALADRVLVMRDGRVVELGETGRVFEEPMTAYTRELLEAAPRTGAAPKTASRR